MEKQDFQARIKAIIEDRLVRVTPEVKEILPAILRGEIEFFTQLTDTYFALIFINDVEKERIRKLRERSIQPFPFLIKPEGIAGSSAFRFEKSKFVWIEACTVKNAFSFSLGKDTTVILSNHKQIVNTKELGLYEYLIKLGYVISFGDEINRDNFYGTFEDLIGYSLKSWADHR